MTALGIGGHDGDAADALDISVILCTRNRVASLRETLASVSRLKLPVGKTVEAFIVDNGSVDGSAAVIRDFQWPGVAIHRLLVAEPGLPRSQNTALRQARGRVIMFLDDDVRPPDNWLAELSEPVLSGEADAVGGGVLIAEQVKPSWIRPEHEEWLASTAHWEATREPLLVGANMAIGRHVFRAIGGFDEDVAWAPDALISHRLVAVGFKLVLRHDIVMEHWVEAARFTRAGLAKQAGRRAETQAFLVHHWEGRRFSFPHLRWLGATLRLTLHRAASGRLTNGNLALPEMRLMQRIAFWPAYLRCRKEPRRFSQIDGVTRRRDRVRGIDDTAIDAASTVNARRFVLVTTSYPGFAASRPGGMESYARLMIAALLGQGWSVDVLCLVYSGPVPEPRQEGGLTLRGVRLPQVHWRLAFLRPVIHGLALWRAVRRVDAAHRFDAIEVPHEGGIGWAVVMAFGRRCFLRLHTTSRQHATFAATAPDAEGRAAIRWDRFTAHRARHLVAATRAHARSLADETGVPLARFTTLPLAIMPPLRGATDAPRDRVLFLGAMERRKGVDVFLDAAAIARERGSMYRWTAVGRWAAQWTGEAAAGAVEVVDAASDADLERYWAETRFVVVPSRYESFGLVALEAMARGIVVIAARIAAFEEVIGDCGVLTTPGRPDEIVAAIERLDADPRGERALAAAALERYHAVFSLAAFAERLNQVLSPAERA